MTQTLLSRGRAAGMRLVAVVLGLVAAEAIARGGLYVCARNFRPPAAAMGTEILSRLWYSYSGGMYSALEVSSRLATYDPHRGYRQASGLRDEHAFGSTLSTNSVGVRGEKEYAVPKPASVTRLVALGDSMTFGEGVADDATWPAQLAAAMPGVEVANLGGRGYAHDQMYFALVDDGLALKPDIVVLGFFARDLIRDETTFYAYEKPRFARAGGGWQIENVPVPTQEETIRRAKSWPLVYALPRGILEMMHRPNPDTDYDPARAREILRRTAAAASDAHARFVLVSLPEHPDGEQEERSFFDDYCMRTGAECVDTLPLFHLAPGDPKKLPGPYSLPHNVHYSREGYAVVAEALRAYLTTHPVAPAPPEPTTTQTSGR